MKLYQTSIPDYYLRVDHYPYTKSRELVASCEWWWDHPSRAKYSDKKSNYGLDPIKPNSIEYSFQHRLSNGNFTFLYYKNQIVSYQGLLINTEGTIGFSHRFAADPINFKLGLFPAVCMPWLVIQARKKECRYYQQGWEIYNKRQYDILRTGTHIRSPLYKFRKNQDIIFEKFHYLGLQPIYHTEQYIARFDLTEDWLPGFVADNPYTEIEDFLP